MIYTMVGVCPSSITCTSDELPVEENTDNGWPA